MWYKDTVKIQDLLEEIQPVPGDSSDYGLIDIFESESNLNIVIIDEKWPSLLYYYICSDILWSFFWLLRRSFYPIQSLHRKNVELTPCFQWKQFYIEDIYAITAIWYKEMCIWHSRNAKLGLFLQNMGELLLLSHRNRYSIIVTIRLELGLGSSLLYIRSFTL